LLDSIELGAPGEGLASGNIDNLQVVNGRMEPRRLFLLARIERLGRRGVNIKAFKDQFNQIEKIVPTASPADLNAALNKLADKVAEQDGMIWVGNRQAGPGGRRYGRSYMKASNQAYTRPGGKMLATYARVVGRLREYQQEGKDITAYTAQLDQVKTLDQQGRFADAKKMLNNLATSLGL
jgi:hypothetical protein